MVCVNATALSASPWADRSNRSRSVVLSHRLPSRRVRAPSPLRRPAKTPSCAHRSIRHTLGHLLSVGQERYMWVTQSAGFGPVGGRPAGTCIGADNAPVTFKVVSPGMLGCWAGIHGSQADESESLFDRGSRRRQDFTHPTIRPRQF